MRPTYMALKAPSGQFRILALPLVRLPRPASASSTASTSASDTSAPSTSTSSPTHPLLLFHVSQPPPLAPSPIDTSPPGETSDALSPVPAPAPPEAVPIHQRALNMGSKQWLKLGEKKEGTWLRWFYDKGEGLMDKIEYEEWALKGVQEGLGVKVAKEGEKQERIEVPLLYPTLKNQPLPPLIPHLQQMLDHRAPYHKKMMTRSLIGVPFTFPFAIIPVLPNFPMFYVLWRAWSHFKAWRGALYLDQLLKLGMIVETPSKALNEIYEWRRAVPGASGDKGQEDHAPDETSSRGVHLGAGARKQGGGEVSGSEVELPAHAKGEAKTAPDGTATPASMVYSASSASSSSPSDAAPSQSKSKSKKQAPYPGLLLTLDQVPLLTEEYGLRQTEVIDVNRAVEQADIRAKRALKANESGGA